MSKNKTDARKIMEDRDATYGNDSLPGDYCDETTLLLMQQDFYERSQRRQRRLRRMATRKGTKRND